MKTTLYLQGASSDEGQFLQCPLSSSAVLFILRYCQTSHFELTFINDKKANITWPCTLCLTSFADLNITFKSWSEIPNFVRNVALPSVYQPELSLVRSGLCVLLRYIVKEVDREAPDKHLIDLLGFRQGSMRMCSEVSSWTKLCEVELSQSLSHLILTLSHLYDSAEGSNGDLVTNVTLPPDLIKLENHFQKKCKIHNDDKKRRAELVRLKEHFSHQLENGTCSSINTSDGITDTAEMIDDSEHGHSNSSMGNVSFKSAVQSSKMTIKRLSYENHRLQIDQVVQLYHGIRKLKVDKTFAAAVPVGESVTTVPPSDNSRTGNTEAGSACYPDILELVEKLTYLDIGFVHTYSEGIEMTIADLILFAFIYHFLEALNFNSSSLAIHLSNTLQWMSHMNSLTAVAEAGKMSGWDINSLISCLETESSVSSIGANSPKIFSGKVVIFVKEADVVEDEDEMELSQCIKIKYRAIKPEVLQTLKKFEVANILPLPGAHPCGANVEVDWTSLPSGVNPKEGDVPETRTQRKCQQLENLVTAVQAVARPGDVLVDFCSGGGHLGIVMAYLLPKCQVYLVENKEESLLKACSRLGSLNLSNVTLYQCNLDYFVGKFDVGVCLHACGPATDMVLQLCLNSLASFVICPCCYGSIKKTHLLSYPRSKQFLQTDITYKDFLTLGHAADQTEFNIALEERGRQCMNLVDTDRAQYAREHGYTVILCSLRPLSCTPKNNLLIGTLNKL